MYFDEEYEKKEKQREIEMKKQWQKNEQDRIEANNKILEMPAYLSDEEKEAYSKLSKC